MTNLNDVLLAMSNIPVVDPIAEIWGRGLQGGRYTVIEYTGALPLTIKANGEPLIDYRIYGNTVQNGTPTPENPIVPSGCGEKTGNLFDMSFYEGKSGITVSGNKATGTCDRFFNVRLSIPPELYGQNLTWSVYFKRPDNPNTVRLQTVDNGSYKYGNNIAGEGRSTISFTATSTIKLYVNYANIGSDTIELSNITLNIGSTALPYEPYGYKLPILSNSAVTNIYLGEVETTRRIKKLVLTGNENTWAQSRTASNTFYFNVSGYLRQRINITICSHYTSQANINGAAEMQDGNVSFYANVGQPYEYFYVRDSNFATVADFKSYLAAQYAAGTPVTVWYVLAEPETGIVNEPLMKIGDYADTVNMEQAGVSIPTNKDTTIIDYDGALKPSQMYIKYLGVKK